MYKYEYPHSMFCWFISIAWVVLFVAGTIETALSHPSHREYTHVGETTFYYETVFPVEDKDEGTQYHVTYDGEFNGMDFNRVLHKATSMDDALSFVDENPTIYCGIALLDDFYLVGASEDMDSLTRGDTTSDYEYNLTMFICVIFMWSCLVVGAFFKWVNWVKTGKPGKVEREFPRVD